MISAFSFSKIVNHSLNRLSEFKRYAWIIDTFLYTPVFFVFEYIFTIEFLNSSKYRTLLWHFSFYPRRIRYLPLEWSSNSYLIIKERFLFLLLFLISFLWGNFLLILLRDLSCSFRLLWCGLLVGRPFLFRWKLFIWSLNIRFKWLSTNWHACWNLIFIKLFHFFRKMLGE